jgi:hypothetical protein
MPARRHPLADDPIVLGLRLVAVEPPQIVVHTVQGDDGLAAGLVPAITRNTS